MSFTENENDPRKKTGVVKHEKKKKIMNQVGKSP